MAAPEYVTEELLARQLGAGADLERITIAVNAANELIAGHCTDAAGVPVEPAPLLLQGALEIAQDFYRAHTATGGVFQVDEVLARLPADRTRKIADFLDAHTTVWGFA